MPNFENSAERGLEALEAYVGKIAEELNREGIAATGDCHIDMQKYEEIYGQQAKKDMLETAERERKWGKQEGKKNSNKQKRLKAGEQMEMFKTAVFHKVLEKDFFVSRSSLFDDYNNGIDNVIVEKQTGNIVGAFDEVVSESDGRGKEDKIAARNTRGGGFLKYGIGIKNNKPVKQANAHIPLFYLALENKELTRAISEFDPSKEELSELEKKLLEKLVNCIDRQIPGIEKIGVLQAKIPSIKILKNALEYAVKN